MFFQKGNEENPAKGLLFGRPLEWVYRAEDLGYVIHRRGSQDTDCTIARGSYNGTSNKLKFCFTRTNIAIQIYACSWYVLNLWNLYGEAEVLEYHFKIAHRVPRQTRTNIVDNLMCFDLPSVKQLIIRRYL